MADMENEDPFAIQIMSWCPESRMLCVAGVSSNVIIYRFSKLEVITEVVQVSVGGCVCVGATRGDSRDVVMWFIYGTCV